MTAVAPARATAPLCLAIEAMATRFELVIPGADGNHEQRAIAEEALAEIVRLDTRLSIYRPMSDLSWINAHAAEQPIKVEPRLFALLRRFRHVVGHPVAGEEQEDRHRLEDQRIVERGEGSLEGADQGEGNEHRPQHQEAERRALERESTG